MQKAYQKTLLFISCWYLCDFFIYSKTIIII